MRFASFLGSILAQALDLIRPPLILPTLLPAAPRFRRRKARQSRPHTPSKRRSRTLRRRLMRARRRAA